MAPGSKTDHHEVDLWGIVLSPAGVVILAHQLVGQLDNLLDQLNAGQVAVRNF